VSSSRDPLEREADAMADRALSMSRSPSPRAPPDSAAMSRGFAASPPPARARINASDSPLDTATRELMEPAFGQDFSRVRIFAGPAAADSARRLNARAYTVGSSIVFGQGQYAPDTLAGQRLLAHELAHTVQQQRLGGGVVQRAEVDDSSTWCEGMDDIGKAFDAKVNSEIEEARKTAPAGFEKDDLKRRNFLVDVLGRLSALEHWVSWLPEARRPAKDSGTKYLGSAVVGPQSSGVAAVIKTGGVCIGADKVGHFFQDGFNAFKADDTETARLRSVDDEIGGQGLEKTGVYSNADILANLAGRKFYRALDAAPLTMKFTIGDYISRNWNEVENPSFYTEGVGSIVWKNLLESNWTGVARFGGSRKSLDVTFEDVDLSKMVCRGSYQEKLIPDGSDPWNQNLTLTGKLSAWLELATLPIEGLARDAEAVYGLSMSVVLDMDNGPDRVGWFTSEGERKLVGEWTEDESGNADEQGPWWLETR